MNPRSVGNTGDLGYTEAQTDELHAMNITGDCDVCHKKPATRWFGLTSCAVCDDDACAESMQQRFDASLAAQDDASDA